MLKKVLLLLVPQMGDEKRNVSRLGQDGPRPKFGGRSVVMSKSERGAAARTLMMKRAWLRVDPRDVALAAEYAATDGVSPTGDSSPASALELLQALVMERGAPGPWLLRLAGVGGSVHAFAVNTDGSVEACTETVGEFERVCPVGTITIPTSRVLSLWRTPAAWRTAASETGGEAFEGRPAHEVRMPAFVAEVDEATGRPVDLARIFTAAAAASTFAESAAPKPLPTSINEKKEDPS